MEGDLAIEDDSFAMKTPSGESMVTIHAILHSSSGDLHAALAKSSSKEPSPPPTNRNSSESIPKFSRSFSYSSELSARSKSNTLPNIIVGRTRSGVTMLEAPSEAPSDILNDILINQYKKNDERLHEERIRDENRQKGWKYSMNPTTTDRKKTIANSSSSTPLRRVITFSGEYPENNTQDWSLQKKWDRYRLASGLAGKSEEVVLIKCLLDDMEKGVTKPSWKKPFGSLKRKIDTKPRRASICTPNTNVAGKWLIEWVSHYLGVDKIIAINAIELLLELKYLAISNQEEVTKDTKNENTDSASHWIELIDNPKTIFHITTKHDQFRSRMVEWGKWGLLRNNRFFSILFNNLPIKLGNALQDDTRILENAFVICVDRNTAVLNILTVVAESLQTINVQSLSGATSAPIAPAAASPISKHRNPSLPNTSMGQSSVKGLNSSLSKSMPISPSSITGNVSSAATSSPSLSATLSAPTIPIASLKNYSKKCVSHYGGSLVISFDHGGMITAFDCVYPHLVYYHIDNKQKHSLITYNLQKESGQRARIECSLLDAPSRILLSSDMIIMCSLAKIVCRNLNNLYEIVSTIDLKEKTVALQSIRSCTIKDKKLLIASTTEAQLWDLASSTCLWKESFSEFNHLAQIMTNDRNILMLDRKKLMMQSLTSEMNNQLNLPSDCGGGCAIYIDDYMVGLALRDGSIQIRSNEDLSLYFSLYSNYEKPDEITMGEAHHVVRCGKYLVVVYINTVYLFSLHSVKSLGPAITFQVAGPIFKVIESEENLLFGVKDIEGKLWIYVFKPKKMKKFDYTKFKKKINKLAEKEGGNI